MQDSIYVQTKKLVLPFYSHHQVSAVYFNWYQWLRLHSCFFCCCFQFFHDVPREIPSFMFLFFLLYYILGWGVIAVVETKILEMAFGSKKARSSRRGVGARKRASQRAQGKTQRAGPIPLTATQKATIVASHFQIIERQAQHGIQVLEDTIDHLVANIDALEEDHKDYAHDVKKFDRTMQPHAITHKFSTDIFKHYADDKAKHLSGQIEGLRLRGHIARNANRDAIERLSSLGDMEGSITRVDFDQIKIRNEQYVAVLSQCNIDLVEEKMKTSHSDKTQNKYLEALREKQVATDIVNSSMADVARMSKRLVREYKAVVEECEINKRANKRLRKQVAAWKVPAVITYVADQAKADETKKAISSWQHRVQVAGFEVKKHKRAWLVVAKQAQMIR